MCFSLTASVVAGTALSVAGVATVVKVKRRADLPFAMMPLLFGIQQFIEALVWLSFYPGMLWLNASAVSLYSLFAYVLWPIYVPFAVWSLETVVWRKKFMLVFQAIGVLVGAYLLYTYLQAPITAQIVNKSIVYITPYVDIFWITFLYIMATCISTLFSSRKIVNVFGLLMFIFAAVAYQFYSVSFVSVWCYFTAVLSIIIYWYIRTESSRKK